MHAVRKISFLLAITLRNLVLVGVGVALATQPSGIPSEARTT